jgi:hypothetical protein
VLRFSRKGEAAPNLRCLRQDLHQQTVLISEATSFRAGDGD